LFSNLILYINYILFISYFFSIIFYFLLLIIFLFNNYINLVLFFICILGESNRVPYDLPEAESESVAGFITEYSSLIFSLILFTEYASIIACSFLLIIYSYIIIDYIIFILFLICLIRSTLNRFKFDELMTNA